MEEKSAWDKFFDDTEEIQCISCLDAYVLEYYAETRKTYTQAISVKHGRKRTYTIRHYIRSL